MDRKKHWEDIYQSKNTAEVSWFQASPTTSLQFVKEFKLPLSARIIDVGGGDSFMVDRLLEMGYSNITVLDISETAIKKAQQRLGAKADTVKWIVADAAGFQPTETYDFWHDRAAFHFLTDKQEISNYVDTIRSFVKPGGYLVLGTFSEQGPTKCSGIEIKQYSENTMTSLLTDFFNKIRCISVDHKTPFNTLQNFIFCSFRRLAG
ncbi:trans-aconitate 2-methyltransferase [Draconibacterium sp.]|uniref:class I SAM-dependent methyltransferase n=1 Tax=Draconibacterium sp. TaxID=1965318 RepID=UPI0035652017